MMAVSCTKAMLVIMFFMHLLWEANWKWVLTIPASCMSIFLLLMLIPDVGMRQDNGWAWYSRDRWLYAPIRRPCKTSIVQRLDDEEQAALATRRPLCTSGQARQHEAVRGWFHPRAMNRLPCLTRPPSKSPTSPIATATTWRSPICR